MHVHVTQHTLVLSSPYTKCNLQMVTVTLYVQLNHFSWFFHFSTQGI